MKFRNQIHKKEFSQATAKIADLHSASAAAIYLLSADKKLWNAAKRNIHGNRINFSKIRPQYCSTEEYLLLCAAKDLYIKTRNISLVELSDARAMTANVFCIICNALAIRRFGYENYLKGEE